MPHVEVKIVDPATDLIVDRGATGELCTRGYSVMLGYWADEDKTAEAVDRAGWMRTGDLAVMREDGYLSIVGRSRHMVRPISVTFIAVFGGTVVFTGADFGRVTFLSARTKLYVRRC